jgi:flagellar M-ring protein FliF
MQFEGVEHATVHLGKPPSSPFAMHQEEVTASVVIQTRADAAFSSRQAAAIVATVSQGVEGLLPENVTVTDTQGRILSNNAPGGGAAHIAGQLEYRQRVEADLAANAQLLLAQLVGHGRAVVRVTADIDFNSRTKEETSYDPDRKVRKTEKIDTSETRGPIETAAGITGITPQIQGAAAAAKGDALVKKEVIDTTYENAMTLDKVYEAAGTIKRLTVAAVVDLGALAGDEKTAEITPQKLEGIIKQAVGFDAGRQDEIELLIAPLAAVPVAEAPKAAAPWREYEALVRSASLGIAALVALILGTLALRKVPSATPAPAPAVDVTALDTRRAQVLASLSDAVRRNPEQLKDALTLWLNTDEDSNQYPAKAA